MRIVRRSLAVCLAVLFMAPAVQAQDHVIDKSALDKAVQQRVSQEQADRDAIVSLLHRSEVRDIAARAGISLDTAEAAVSTLKGNDLRRRLAGTPGAERSRGRRLDDRDLDDDDHHRSAPRHPHRRDRGLTHSYSDAWLPPPSS